MIFLFEKTTNRYRRNQGFTLIELMISLVILSLLITVLYQAFATASRVWTKQEVFDEVRARQMAVSRLIRSDFQHLLPYHYLGENGEYDFFAMAPNVVFYATSEGFGARNRDRFGLFFTCCYLQPEDDGTLTLKLFKTSHPETDFLDLFEQFLGQSVQEQQAWVPPLFLRENSVTVLSGVTNGGFFTFSLPISLEELDIDEEERFFQRVAEPFLLQREVPPGIRFIYQFNQDWYRHEVIPFCQPDPTVTDEEAGQ
nr:type II secretion system protein [uncultured Desulfuromonas sp.]